LRTAPDALRAHALGKGLAHGFPFPVAGVQVGEKVVYAIGIEQLHTRVRELNTITGNTMQNKLAFTRKSHITAIKA
jgi:hypothetical protein